MDETLRVAFIGSVDDGKSTLIGRLLVDTGSLYADHLASLQTANGIELSWVTDGLLSEREQGITIDVAYRHFAGPTRNYLIADVPGHEAHVGNMMSGTSFAHAAVLLLDAERGPTKQTFRHLAVAHLAGVRTIFFAINKMDLVDYSRSRFESLRERLHSAAKQLGFDHYLFLPMSGLTGEGVARTSHKMSWYDGPCLLDALETLTSPDDSMKPLRLPVQTVLRANNERHYAGRIQSGTLTSGQEVVLLPSKRTSRVTALTIAGRSALSAQAGDSVAIMLEGDFDLGRGDLVSDVLEQPSPVHEVEAKVAWIGREPLQKGTVLFVRHMTLESRAEAIAVDGISDFETGDRSKAECVRENEIGLVTLKLSRSLSCDLATENHLGARLVLVDRVNFRTVGAGVVTRMVSQAERLKPQAHTVWMTGLPGAGKSTLAEALRRRYVDRGQQVVILDGDALRAGLCRDLGFSEEDRAENLRRVAEVCKILNDSGVSAVVALISPFREARKYAREIIGEDRFFETFIDAPLEVCQARDPKGLYRKAARGEITNLTGVGAPYEAPSHPDLHLRTDLDDVESCLDRFAALIG